MAKTKESANTLAVSLTPAPEASQGGPLLAQAQGISIVDRVSHEAARTFLKGAKALKRAIVEHYDAIKKPLNAARNTVLDMERQHLAPVEQAIALAEKADTAYVREQEAREREEADRRRREAEERERQAREREAAEAEAKALELEGASDDLSAREAVFVRLFVATRRTVNDATACASKAGYKDPKSSVAKLLDSKKVNAAIAAADQAAAIRRESEAKQAAPINVEVAPVESQIGKVAGTSLRTYYSCGEVDLAALVLVVAEDIKAGDTSKLLALQPNMVYLNGQARDLREMFPRVWMQCKLDKRSGVAG